MTLSATLAHNTVFAHLSTKDRQFLAESVLTRSYKHGEWIVHAGDDWPYLFIIETGVIAAVKESVEGRSLKVMTLGAGEIFWGISFFIKEAPMPVALQADEPAKLHLWPAELLVPLILENGKLSWALTCLMVERMQRASFIVEEFAFQTVTGRLARLLLDHFGEAVSEPMTRDMTLDEMAARIGSTREMVCRQLYRLSDQGVIHINRTEFKITNPRMLEQIGGKTTS
jgi:CRP/FNR family transcriptional regulator